MRFRQIWFILLSISPVFLFLSCDNNGTKPEPGSGQEPESEVVIIYSADFIEEWMRPDVITGSVCIPCDTIAEQACDTIQHTTVCPRGEILVNNGCQWSKGRRKFQRTLGVFSFVGYERVWINWENDLTEHFEGLSDEGKSYYISSNLNDFLGQPAVKVSIWFHWYFPTKGGSDMDLGDCEAPYSKVILKNLKLKGQR